MTADFSKVTYKDYCTAVHVNHKNGSQDWTLTETFVKLLQQVRPQLHFAVLTHVDPAKPPYRIKEFLDLVKENWDKRLEPKK